MKNVFVIQMAIFLSGCMVLLPAGGCDAGQARSKTTRFKRITCVDRQGIGSEAFSMLIPYDWRFSGGIQWLLENPGMPAVASFTVTSPDGLEALEAFPNQSLFWTNNQMLLSTFPVGSRYFGSEVRPPMGPSQALEQIVLPRFRGNVGRLEIVGREDLPDLARSLGAGTQSQPGVMSSAEGAKVRIRYTLNGQAMEEEIFCVVESISFQIQTMYGPVTNTMWTVGYIVGCRAPRGRLDAEAKTFQTMIHSFSINTHWFNKYGQLVDALIQNQIRQIQNLGQISRIISQTSNEISDMMMDSYNQRQKVYDRMSTNFSQYMRGVDEYRDPVAGRSVELPSGYRNAWSNSLGEYVLSDDPGFNPNQDLNGTWQKIERRQ